MAGGEGEKRAVRDGGSGRGRKGGRRERGRKRGKKNVSADRYPRSAKGRRGVYNAGATDGTREYCCVGALKHLPPPPRDVLPRDRRVATPTPKKKHEYGQTKIDDENSERPK